MIPEVAHTGDFQRIFDLPRRVWSDSDLAALAAELTAILRAPAGGRCPAKFDRAEQEKRRPRNAALGLCPICESPLALRPVQALALHDAGVEGGVFGNIGVGDGKTLISFLLPLVLASKRPLLLLPGGLIENAQRARLALSYHWRIPNIIRLFSYDMLGRVQAADALDTYQPDDIICDEAARLKNRRAAVTRRVARYMYEHPHTRFCALSGTFMDKSLKDFAHILRWSLKLHAPVPLSNEETEEWAEVLDNGVDPLARRKPGALLEWADNDCSEGEHVAARRGFRRRLIETPGVVATVGEGEHVGASIYLRESRQKASEATERHFAKLRTEWATPDGWELSQASDVWRHANELALGFHYVRVDKEKYAKWLGLLKKEENTSDSIELRTSKKPELTIKTTTPRTERLGGRDIPEDEERDSTGSLSRPTRQSTKAKQDVVPFAVLPDRFEASWGSESTMITPQDELEDCSVTSVTPDSDYSVTLSTIYREQFPTFLEGARPPREWLDARSAWAKFVRETLSRSRSLDSELQVANACDAGKLSDGALKAWRAIKDAFNSATVPVWHDDSALRTCIDWMKTPGIVWVGHTYFGACLSAVSGVPYYAEGGYALDGSYIEDAEPGSSAIASLCNREGKNLQRLWSRNLLVCPPSSAAWCEQLIARTHRPGQMADVVIVDILLGCREHWTAITKAIEAARAVQDVTGKVQKLLLADVTLPSEAEIDALRTPRWVK